MRWQIPNHNDIILGMVCPVLTSSADYLSPNVNPSNSELNASWYSTQLMIDFESLETYYDGIPNNAQKPSFTDVIMSTIIHEFGHSLKMPHTYLYYNMDDGKWRYKSFSPSVMNPYASIDRPVYLQGVDYKRFDQKWESY